MMCVLFTDGRDFTGINDTLEFGVRETKMEVIIFITDNSALEDVEELTVEIEPIPGAYPVAVFDSVATVTITDNDGSLQKCAFIMQTFISHHLPYPPPPPPCSSISQLLFSVLRELTTPLVSSQKVELW